MISWNTVADSRSRWSVCRRSSDTSAISAAAVVMATNRIRFMPGMGAHPTPTPHSSCFQWIRIRPGNRW